MLTFIQTVLFATLQINHVRQRYVFWRRRLFMYLTVAWFDEFLHKMCVNILVIFCGALLDELLLPYGGVTTSLIFFLLNGTVQIFWSCNALCWQH